MFTLLLLGLPLSLTLRKSDNKFQYYLKFI